MDNGLHSTGGVRRALAKPEPMLPQNVVYFADAAGKRAFHCAKLHADLSTDACAAQYARALLCSKCPTGAHHSGMAPRVARDIAFDPNADVHARSAARNSMACVRCGRSSATWTGTCQFRLVLGGWCVGCYNRSGEQWHGGLNSKGAPISKWRHLHAVRLTVRDMDGNTTTLKPFMTSGPDESSRYAERLHPGSTIVATEIVPVTNAAAAR